MAELSQSLWRKQSLFETKILSEIKAEKKFLFPNVGDQGRTRPNVAIIGGGACGLTAARELLNQGASVTIYEASPRLGGRLYSVEIGGKKVDVGASYVHGCEDVWRCVPYRFCIERADVENECCPWLEGVEPLPLCAIDRRWGGYSESWGTSPWRTEEGKVISSIDIRHYTNVMMQCISRCPEDIQRNPYSSVIEAYEAGKSRSRRGAQAELEKVPDLIDMALLLRWGYVSEPRMVGTADVFGDPVMGGSVFGRHVPQPTRTTNRSGNGGIGLASDGIVRIGFDKLIVEGLQPQQHETATGRAHVLLNRPVKKINVIGQVGQTPTIEIYTADGQAAQYDYCISTVSIGVLHDAMSGTGSMQFTDSRLGVQDEQIFTPYLKTSLQHIGMGTEAKVILQFQHRWWPSEPLYRYFLCPAKKYRFMSLDDYEVEGVLVVHVSPPQSLGIDRNGADADICAGVWDVHHPVVIDILSTLAAMFSQYAKRLLDADPAQILVSAYLTRWDSNSNTRGSYAFHGKGYTQLDSWRLLIPCPDHDRGPLFFAGEGLADHVHGFQCVEGAMCSGLHAARSLIEMWDRTVGHGS
jgi:hypothetical protein